MFKTRLWFSILLLTLLAACGQSAGPSDADLSERQICVVTTIGMITDMVVNVGGERVAVSVRSAATGWPTRWMHSLQDLWRQWSVSSLS